eukprot:EG_transcript_28540
MAQLASQPQPGRSPPCFDFEQDFDAEVAGAVAQVLDALAVERPPADPLASSSAPTPNRTLPARTADPLDAVIAQVLNSKSDSEDNASAPDDCSSDEDCSTPNPGAGHRRGKPRPPTKRRAKR